MKQTRWIFILTILVLTLSACGSSDPSAQPIPTVVLEGGTVNNSGTQSAPQTSSGGDVAASGIVVPAQDAQLAFALTGNVKKVYVAEGDQVKAGDLLAELDNDIVQVEVDQAQRTVRELTSQAAIAAAEQAVAAAQTTYEDAKKKADSYKLRRGDQADIDYYKAQLVLAQKALDRAQDTYNKTSRLSSADPLRATATTNLFNAQKAYNTALANLNWFAETPSENDVALATANLDSASAALQEARWYLAELKGESIPSAATGSKLAQLQQARDNLKAAQDKFEHTRLLSPISGTVTTVNIVAGEYVAPGQTIIAISDVANLQVVTTDLSERDVSNVSVGQNVTVFVEALNAEITGQVLLISAIADTLGGDVVYKTTIALDELPEGIRAGMSVTVQYEP
jgi:multidrug efflux pump subunit AcrA (membrane-fusion protein)